MKGRQVKKNGHRILCFGLCVTGPSSGQYTATAVSILVLDGINVMSYFLYCELFSD